MNKGGRPRKKLTDEQFEQLKQMVRIQCTRVECCNIFGMTEKTLDRNLKDRGEDGFSSFFEKYGDEGKASLRRQQWKAAMSGNPTMLVWLGKQMLGQRDKQDVDQTGNMEVVFKTVFEAKPK